MGKQNNSSFSAFWQYFLARQTQFHCRKELFVWYFCKRTVILASTLSKYIIFSILYSPIKKKSVSFFVIVRISLLQTSPRKEEKQERNSIFSSPVYDGLDFAQLSFSETVRLKTR